APGRGKPFRRLIAGAAPRIASYLTYYVIKPHGRTNYGDLLDPRPHPMPELTATTLDGKPESLQAYHGKWIMLQADGAACDEACQKKLYYMRQLRLTQGKDMDRIERVWLITDREPLETMVLREYDGTHFLRASREQLQAWLPAAPGAGI